MNSILLNAINFLIDLMDSILFITLQYQIKLNRKWIYSKCFHRNFQTSDVSII